MYGEMVTVNCEDQKKKRAQIYMHCVANINQLDCQNGQYISCHHTLKNLNAG
jgi:hypothetical protein